MQLMAYYRKAWSEMPFLWVSQLPSIVSLEQAHQSGNNVRTQPISSLTTLQF